MLNIEQRVNAALDCLDKSEYSECRKILINIIRDSNDFMCCCKSLREISAEEFSEIEKEFREVLGD